MKRIAVIGSRCFDDAELVASVLTPLLPFVLVSGAARGADTLGEAFADQCGLDKLIFPAEWKKHGVGAGYLRNITLIDHSDEVIAFWNGHSRGTKHAMDYAREQGKFIRAISVNC